jgi:hypothetical protein
MKNPYQLSPIGISSQFDSKKLSSALLLPKKPFLPLFIFRRLDLPAISRTCRLQAHILEERVTS